METIWSLLADPAVAAAVGAVSAFVAVPIAILALMSSHKTSRRMVEIEEARDVTAGRQASKAVLVTNWEARYLEPTTTTPHLCGHLLTVTNQGGGPARRILVVVDGEDVTSDAKSPLDADGRVSRLDAGAIFKIYFSLRGHFGEPRHRVRVEWEDGSGEPGLYESDL